MILLGGVGSEPMDGVKGGAEKTTKKEGRITRTVLLFV